MRMKMILGIIAVICGIILFAFSGYITKQVAIGRGQIYEGQAKVNTANQLVDNTTQIKGLGGVFTGSAQEKINEGTRKANYYDRLAHRLKLSGIVLFIVGAFLLLFSKIPRKWFRLKK